MSGGGDIGAGSFCHSFRRKGVTKRTGTNVTIVPFGGKMNREDILKNVYEDFFGAGEGLNKSSKSRQSTQNTALNSNEVYNELLAQIENLYLEDNSKTTLKNILEYMRKWSEKIENTYIPFNMVIYTDNFELKEELLTILEKMVAVFKYLKDSKTKEISMYDMQNLEDFNNIYLNNNIVILKDLEVLLNKEENLKEQFMHKLEENLTQDNNMNLTILIAKNKDEVKTLFENRVLIQNRLLNFEINGINPNVNEAYQEILEKLKDSMEVSQKMQIDLLDYLVAVYEKQEMPYPEFRNNLINTIIFNKEIPRYEQNKSMDEIFEELDSLVGLQKVKQLLRDLVSLTKLKEKSSEYLKLKNINLHMVFLGNPGTGKTTVARIVAKILYELKYIKSDKLIEVTSKDLVAEYVGQTAIKTMNVVNRAMGGVLFIDEAYSLASGKGEGNSFNEEAVATLIQAMENNRDNLVVIFAGYTKEMQDFLNLNSGIVSRIGYNVEFDDYTEDELIQIFKQMMGKAGFIVQKDAIETLREIIKKYINTKNFGNARFVRNVYEKTIIKHASNTENKKAKKDLKTITKQDISDSDIGAGSFCHF